MGTGETLSSESEASTTPQPEENTPKQAGVSDRTYTVNTETEEDGPGHLPQDGKITEVDDQ